MRILAAVVAVLLSVSTATADLTLVSANRSRSGSGNGASKNASASGDGTLIAFQSDASDLVDNDGNSWTDVFVYDARGQSTALVSVNTSGTSGNRDSHDPIVSADGRYVLFTSSASDLVSTPVSRNGDVFVRDLATNTTTLVSVNRSGDGGGNAGSNAIAISADGATVLFRSLATDLVTLSDDNNEEDIFARNMRTGETQLVSMNRYGDGTPNDVSFDATMSADGRFAAFCSIANNVIPNDGNTNTDIFLRDLVGRQTTLVSANTAAQPANRGAFRPSVSRDGRRISFDSIASDLTTADANGNDSDIFVRDLPAGPTRTASVDESGATVKGDTFKASLSADGRFVVFTTPARLLAIDQNGISDAYARDIDAGHSILLNSTAAGVAGNGGSLDAVISASARFAAFVSTATNLGFQDSNSGADVFVKDLVTGELRLVSATPGGSSGDRSSSRPRISDDGSTVVFESAATNLVSGDKNNTTDVFASFPPAPTRRRTTRHP